MVSKDIKILLYIVERNTGWPSTEAFAASGDRTAPTGRMAVIGKKKILAVRWNTSGANPMGCK